MKKSLMSILALLFCLVMLSTIVLTSCDSSKDSDETQGTEPGTETSAPDEKAPEDNTVVADGVTLNKNELTLEKGRSETLTAAVTPENTTDKNVTWSTSNESVATVENGTVKAIATGTATITVTTANGKTATCQVTVISSSISFKSLGVDDAGVYGKVSNATSTFSFTDEITISGNASFKVYSDAGCNDIVQSDAAALEIGNNTFYVTECIGDEVSSIYVVTVRRRPMHTVTFDTNGGTAVASQTIEEDGFVVAPANPTKDGYIFAGWSRDLTLAIVGTTEISAQWTGNPYLVTYDANGGSVNKLSTSVTMGSAYALETPTKTGYTFVGWYYGEQPVDLSGNWNIAESITLVAKWTANTDTLYKVEHWIEKLDGTYELKDTENLKGTTDASVTPSTKNYAGFTSPVTQTVTILPDGSQVVRYEYTRNSYTVTFLNENDEEIEVITLKFEEAYSFSTPKKNNHMFGGWYSSDPDIQKIDLTGTWTITKNVTVKETWIKVSSESTEGWTKFY